MTEHEVAAPYQELAVQDDEYTEEEALARSLMVVRTGFSAIDWAYHQHVAPSKYWRGLCLQFVRMCFNVGSRYPSAESAYYHTTKRHGSWPPPPGVPVWWTNGRYGHVALSAGGGYVWSTDYLRTGKVDKVLISSITRGWGQRYRGWTEDINGVHVYSPKPVIDLSNVIYAARHSRRIHRGRMLKKAVAAEVGRGHMITSTGWLGKGFRTQYRLVQKKYLKHEGIPYSAAAADGIPGMGSLQWLGRRHGFDVRR